MKLLNEDEDALIRSATTYVVKGDLTEEQLEAVKEYCINPVDSREAAADLSLIHIYLNVSFCQMSMKT